MGAGALNELGLEKPNNEPMDAIDSGASTVEYGQLGISLSGDDHLSLAGRIYAGIREAIVDGRMAAGQRLPSTRALADELGVARGTVVEAYEQLALEGYVRSERGSGTFVDDIPERFLHTERASSNQAAAMPAPDAASRAHAHHPAIIDHAQARVPRPFLPGLAPLDGFPRHVLARLAGEAMRGLSFEDLSYGDPRGYYPLRRAIASYLGTARAARCEPDQVFVTNGAQQALSLAANTLLDPGEAVWVENPGYRGSKAVFVKAGLDVVPVPVDDAGLCIETGAERAPHARLIYVTPSHQYPLGVTMSARRRLELIEWAGKHNAWIIEDDYDSEYRYDGAPIPALHHFDGGRRVVYIGSFSKVLAPGLRLGYAVVPDALVEFFMRTRSSEDHHSSIFIQTVLARFITEGHYGRHLRRMRKLGEERRDAMIAAFARHIPHLRLSGTSGGLHAVAHFDPSADDQLLARRAAERGVSLSALSLYDLDEPPQKGFVLGYAAYTERQIDAAARQLSGVLASAV